MNIKRKILIVDDHQMNRSLIIAFLNSFDCEFDIEFLEAENGKEALDLFSGFPSIDVVILDIMMPEYDGFYFLENFKKEYSDKFVPVIVMSALSDQDIIQKAFQYGIYDYFTKPVASETVFSLKLKIKNAIEMKDLVLKIQRNKETMERDLQLASSLQNHFLPDKIDHGVFKVDYVFKPYFGLSGDYIDIFKIDDDNYLFLLADVAGHGTASAIIGAILKTHTIDFINNSNDFVLEDYSLALNKSLIKLNYEDNLVTAFLGVFNIKNLTLKYNLAGHPYPLILNFKNNTVRTIEENAFLPFGLFEGIKIDKTEVKFEKGDVLIAYSDGIIEGRDSDNNLFGIEHLIEFAKEFVENHNSFNYDEFITSLEKNVMNIKDDLTIMCITVKE